jgi:hypothetical protein
MQRYHATSALSQLRAPSAGDERRWHLEAEGLGGFEIDCEV